MPTIQSSNKMAGKGGVKIAVHSAAGMGKTMLAATCPKPVIILTERTGADSLSEANIRDVYGDKKGITYDIPIVEAYNVPDMEAAIEMCRTDKRFETIIFDSVSEMSKLKLKAELPLHYVRREDYVQAIATIMAKLDAMALRFENILLRGERK